MLTHGLAKEVLKTEPENQDTDIQKLKKEKHDQAKEQADEAAEEKEEEEGESEVNNF